MNRSLESSLDPILTKFLERVRATLRYDPKTWVQKAFELSTPVYEFLGNAMLIGFDLSGNIQWALDKVLDTLVMWKAKEEEKLEEKFKQINVGIECCQFLTRDSFRDSSGTLIQKLPECN